MYVFEVVPFAGGSTLISKLIIGIGELRAMYEFLLSKNVTFQKVSLWPSHRVMLQKSQIGVKPNASEAITFRHDSSRPGSKP